MIIHSIACAVEGSQISLRGREQAARRPSRFYQVKQREICVTVIHVYIDHACVSPDCLETGVTGMGIVEQLLSSYFSSYPISL